MSRFVGWVILVLAIGCDSNGGGSVPSPGSGSAAVVSIRQAGAGFSTNLAKRLDMAGTSGDTMPIRTNGNSGETVEADPKQGADANASADTKVAAGSADAKGSAGSADTKVVGSADAKGSADTKSGSADTKSGSADTKVTAVDPKAGSADTKVAKVEPPKVEPPKLEPPKLEPPKLEPPKLEPPKPGSGTSVATAPKIEGAPVIGATTKAPVNTPAELKAINISLLPNWKRDVEAAGTISLAVEVSEGTWTFLFNYGYEDPKAPADRDAYKKWLSENKIFTSKDDRQKGGAWYLEGVDAKGSPAFRMVVLYGGKKLICYGSLYKESKLGDLRDQTVIQAKQICETLAL